MSNKLPASGIRITIPERITTLQVTSVTIDLICQAIRKGLNYEVACGIVGLSPYQMHKLHRDSIAVAEGSPKVDEFTAAYRLLLQQFLEKLVKAEAEWEQEMVQLITDAAPKDWRAAKYLLQVKKPEQYLPERILQRDANSRPGSSKPIDVSTMTDEQLLQYVEGEVLVEESTNASSSTGTRD